MPWTYHAYRWPDAAAWHAALAAAGWQDGAPESVQLLVTGTLYAPAPDDETPPEALPGWHVAAAFRHGSAPEGWAAREIEAPEGMPVLGRAPVPAHVTNFQARVVLMQTQSKVPGVSLFCEIDGTLRAGKDTTPQGALAWQAWEQANNFYRDGSLMNALSGQFGLSAPRIDDLFRRAAEVLA